MYLDSKIKFGISVSFILLSATVLFAQPIVSLNPVVNMSRAWEEMEHHVVFDRQSSVPLGPLGRGLAGLDLAINAFTVPDNYETPQYVIEHDSIHLEVEVINIGDVEGTNLRAIASVCTDQDVEIYADTMPFVNLSPDSSVIVSFNKNYLPGLLPIGIYKLKYKVEDAAGADQEMNSANNIGEQEFRVSENSFLKTPGGSGFGFNGDAVVSGGEDFAFANVYSVPLNGSDLLLTEVSFECFSFEPLDGLTANIAIYELPVSSSFSTGTHINLSGGLLDFDYSLSPDDMTSQGLTVGEGTYFFSAADGTGGKFEISLEYANIRLRSGRIYLVAMIYQGISNLIAQEVGRDYCLHITSSFASFQSLGGWRLISTPGEPYSKNIAVIDIATEEVVQGPGTQCDSAIALSSNGIYNANGPKTGFGCEACDEALHADWYYFDAPAAGTIHINSCLFGVDTRVSAYQGDCSDLNLVAGNDDACPLSTGDSSWASSLSFPVVAAQRYYFEWDDRWSNSPFSFEFLFVPDVGDCSVSNNGDSGEGTLRNAIDCAAGGDTVFISSLLQGDSICLESGKILIDKNLTIVGHPNHDIPIDGSPISQSIEIVSGVSLQLQNIHLLVNPQAGMNAIDNFGDLKLKDVRIEYLPSSTGSIFANEGTMNMEPEVEIVEEGG